MGSLKKKLNNFYSRVIVIERIFIDNKADWEYYDRIQELKKRITKLPNIAQKNLQLMRNELNNCINEFEDLKSEIDPNLIKQYNKNFNKDISEGNF